MARYGVDRNVAYVYFTNNYKETTSTPNGQTPIISNDNGRGSDWMPYNPNVPIDPNGQDNPITPNNSGNRNSHLKEATIGLGLLRTAKQVINYHRTNYGDFFQDSVAQTRINEAYSLGSQAFGIGMGFATGGVLGGASMLLATATTMGLQTATMMRQYHRSNIVSQVNMMRVGNSAINGGR